MLNEGSQIFGIYRAIVTDTSCFETTGKIKTRISVFNGGGVSKDLVNGYNAEIFSESISRDLLTDIMMPFGGGYDYGMFKLPQINAVGLVAFIDASRTKPIWLGSTANQILNNENQVVQLDFPSDQNNGKPAIYYDDYENEPKFNLKDENSFIINTKTNTLRDLTNPDTMVWSNNPVENSFVLNSAKASLYHRVNDKAYQEFVLYNGDKENKTPGAISMLYTVSDTEYKSVSASENGIFIKDKNENRIAQLIFNDEGEIFINSVQENRGTANTGGTRVEAIIKLTPASIELIAGNSRISMNRNIDQNKEKITINATNLQINAKKISFGNSGYSFVVSPNSNLNFTLEDGSMLTTADNIRT